MANTPTAVEEATVIAVDAILHDIKLKTLKDGEREIILRVPAREWANIVKSVPFIGTGAVVTFHFKQLPLYQNPMPSDETSRQNGKVKTIVSGLDQ